MSANDRVFIGSGNCAAVQKGSPLATGPLTGDPFFRRNLRYISMMDRNGRVRLCALTIDAGSV
jgi:hypothetical protein